MEHFEVNGFEQLLINFANERLQQLFINEAVTRVQAEFKFEGVASDDAAFKDNLEVLELIDGKVSILTLLNSQSVSNTQPDDSRLMRELHNAFGEGKHAAFSVPLTTAASQFTICHFAADVTYTVGAAEGAEGFVSKNKDSLLPKLPLLLRGSGSAFLAHLFPEPAGGWGAPQARPPVAQQVRVRVRVRVSLTLTLTLTRRGRPWRSSSARRWRRSRRRSRGRCSTSCAASSRTRPRRASCSSRRRCACSSSRARCRRRRR